MAKTIMISNDLYGDLKKMKEKASFTELISDLLKERREQKLGKNLFRFFGVLEGDKEYDVIMRNLKGLWAAWSKRYV